MVEVCFFFKWTLSTYYGAYYLLSILNARGIIYMVNQVTISSKKSCLLVMVEKQLDKPRVVKKMEIPLDDCHFIRVENQ